MTIKELFDKVETTNEILRVVDKRFNVMISSGDDCREFENFDEFITYLEINYVYWYEQAVLSAYVSWTKPINKILVSAPGYEFIQTLEITLCENDIL